jgi:MoxR-like ATPase
LVLATQNPVDQEGTYSLPKAQIDRLMLKVKIDYPSKEEELEVMRRMSNMAFKPELKTLLTKEDIFSIRNEENQVSISRSLKKYSIELVYATRNAKALGLDKETYYMQFGASPRASINLN